MIVSIIVALDELGGIGKNNALPWKLSADLKLFKQRTMGHHIVMGRKTFESIGKALPGRRTVIVTANRNYLSADTDVVHSLNEALALARSRNESECFVIGGGQIYNAALHVAERIYLTRVNTRVDADTFFPELNLNEWLQVSVDEFPQSDKDEYAFKVVELHRLHTQSS